MALFSPYTNSLPSLMPYQSEKDRHKQDDSFVNPSKQTFNNTSNGTTNIQEQDKSFPDRRTGKDRRVNRLALFQRIDPRSKKERRSNVTLVY